MKLYGAKLLVITCEILARDRVAGILEAHGAAGHTSYEVGGAGARGVRGGGLGAEKNVRIEVVTTEARMHDIMEEVSRTMFADYAVVMHAADVGVVRPEKFG